MSLIAPTVGLGWAPAKINLALHVVGQRGDGYHLIESLVVFTRFGDRVSVAPADLDEFTVTGPYASGVPLGEDNLVLRARDTLRAALLPYQSKNPLSASLRSAPLPHFVWERTGGQPGSRPRPLQGERCRAKRGGEGECVVMHDCPAAEGGNPVSISLEKDLPVASGIGGGSSDAAAALKGLARLWNVEDERMLQEVALSLGADVPMCLSPHPALVSGIGEKIERLWHFPQLFIVLVNPGVEVPTPAVFSRLKTKNNPALGRPLPGDREALYIWLGKTRNDLQAPALELAPVIGDMLAALRATRARFVRMSGSGATCFGLFETSRDAEAAAAEIRRAQPDWFVVATETFAASGEEHDGN